MLAGEHRMLSELSDLWLLLLGWCLGLLGGPVAESIVRRYRAKHLRSAIIAELKELQYNCALVAHDLYGYLGKIDRLLSEWVLTTIESYDGPDRDEHTLELLRKDLSRPPEEQNASLTKKNTSHSKRVVPYQLPFLDANLPALVACSLEFQQPVLNIKSQLELFNGQVASVVSNLSRTFDPSLTGINRQLHDGNINRGYDDLAMRARDIADKIAALRREVARCTKWGAVVRIPEWW